MNVFTWFSDRNNITFLIAIAGFAMSLYNFFRALWDRRCALSIDYVNLHCSPCKGHTRFEIRMNIQNLSSAPLSIVRMYIICDGKSYSFAFPAQEVMEFTHTKGGIETRHSEVLSQSLPFTISGHGVCGAYFAAYLPPELQSKLEGKCKFQLAVQTPQKRVVFDIDALNPGLDFEEYGFFTNA